MATLQQVTKGLTKFLDEELLFKITGLNKWLAGAALSMALEKSDQIFNELKKNPAIKALEIINKNDDIDIDKLYKHLLKQAEKAAVTFNEPFIGCITLRAEDLTKLYQCIRSE